MSGFTATEAHESEKRLQEVRNALRDILANTNATIERYENRRGELSREDRKAVTYWRGQRNVARRISRLVGE